MRNMRKKGSSSNAMQRARRSASLSRLAGIIACSLCLGALLLLCSACGPAFTDEDKAAFTGYWTLVSFGVTPEQKAEDDNAAEEGGPGESASEEGEDGEESEDADQSAEPEETDEEKAAKEKQLSEFDVLLYKEWGLKSDLTLAEDGTCAFNFYGDVYQGTWKMEEASKASIEFIVQNEGKPQKETYDLVLQDGLLTMQIPDLPVVFRKA